MTWFGAKLVQMADKGVRKSIHCRHGRGKSQRAISLFLRKTPQQISTTCMMTDVPSSLMVAAEDGRSESAGLGSMTRGVDFVAVSGSSPSAAWAENLANTSEWFDRLRTEALAVSALRIKDTRGQGRPRWLFRCEMALGTLLSSSPTRRADAASGDLWSWDYWPKRLSVWLAKQMHPSTDQLWTSTDAAALATLAFGADRQDVQRIATTRLSEIQ